MSTRAYSVAAQQITATAPIFYGVITPGSSVALQTRVSDDTGALILPGNVSSISVVVTDLMADTAGSPITITVGSAVYSTLQSWSFDGTGFNVSIELDGTNFPAAQTTYQVIATFTTTNGELVMIWHLQTQDVN